MDIEEEIEMLRMSHTDLNNRFNTESGHIRRILIDLIDMILNKDDEALKELKQLLRFNY